MGGRRSTRTKYPGIYQLHGRRDRRYMVSYRERGRGQRTKSFPTLREARDFQATIRDPAKVRQLRQLERGKVQLSDYFDQWLQRKRNLASTTRLRYEGVGRNFIVPGRLGRLHVASITRDDIEDWVADLEIADVPVPTIDKAYRTLRACLETAVLEGKALANPARRIEIKDLVQREPFFLAANQVEAIATHVPGRDRALVYTLAYTGMRMGEATALRVKNLDLLKKRLRIVESSPEVGGRKLQGSQTKTKRENVVSLSDPLVNELAAHLDRYGRRGTNGDLLPNAYVFTGERGAQVRQGNWRERVFQPTCARLGIERVGRKEQVELPRVHDLRHTAASLAADAGYSMAEVKAMLGHATIRTTERYTHLFEDTKQAKARSLGHVMESAQGRADQSKVVDFPSVR
jgi:integrase